MPHSRGVDLAEASQHQITFAGRDHLGLWEKSRALSPRILFLLWYLLAPHDLTIDHVIDLQQLKPCSRIISFFIFTMQLRILIFLKYKKNRSLTIDYRSEYGRFPMSANSVTISNCESLSSGETGVHPEKRSWKKRSSEWAPCQNAHRWYLSHKEVKGWDLTTWFRIWPFQTPAQKRHLWMHLLISWLNSLVFFWGDDRWILREESRLIKWQQFIRLLTRQLFIFWSSHL